MYNCINFSCSQVSFATLCLLTHLQISWPQLTPCTQLKVWVWYICVDTISTGKIFTSNAKGITTYSLLTHWHTMDKLSYCYYAYFIDALCMGLSITAVHPTTKRRTYHSINLIYDGCIDVSERQRGLGIRSRCVVSSYPGLRIRGEPGYEARCVLSDTGVFHLI